MQSGHIGRVIVIALLKFLRPRRDRRILIAGEEVSDAHNAVGIRAGKLVEAWIHDSNPGDDRLRHSLAPHFPHHMRRFAIEPRQHHPVRLQAFALVTWAEKSMSPV